MKEGTIIKCKTLDEREELINLALFLGVDVWEDDVKDKRDDEYPDLYIENGELTGRNGSCDDDIIIMVKEARRILIKENPRVPTTREDVEKKFNIKIID